MSGVYISEPPTSGRVIFETTHGPLDIQLWCRECPSTTRFFLQLCLDGFYDNMLFHRIVPSFLIQTGAMRQTDTATDDALLRTYRAAVRADQALERRRLERHSRLRFSHRGQVSIALGVDDDDEQDAADLQPQFFVTLEESKNLDGKYVLFGTITGPTFFNAARIGNIDVDPQTHQPVDMEHAPRIVSVRIAENPIHQDLVPQQQVPWRVVRKEPTGKRKKRKGKFDKNVLSFGDEVDDPDDGVLLKPAQQVHDPVGSVDETAATHTVTQSRPEPESNHSAIHALKEEGTLPKAWKDQSRVASSASLDREIDVSRLEQDSQTQGKTSPKQQALPTKESAELPTGNKKPTRSILEIRNEKYRKSKRTKKDREEETLSKLFAFKSKVKGQVTGVTQSEEYQDDSLAARMARRAQSASSLDDPRGTVYRGQVLESDDDEPGGKNDDWLKTTFKCRKHIDHTAGSDGRHMDDYEVIDPNDADDTRKHNNKDSRGKKHRSGDDHRHDRHHQKRHKSHR